MLAITHTTFGFASLLLGAYVLLQPKGTVKHVLAGRIYVVSMYALCFTSFGLFELFDGFGIFHVASIVSLLCITLGVGVALFRHKFNSWVYLHYQFMAWSYIGLLAATSNEIFVHVPLFSEFAVRFPISPLISIFVILTIGGFYLNKIMNRVVEGLKHQGAA